jgi:uncharacterized membrane protein YphA (DoxX/SURF4 family)
MGTVGAFNLDLNNIGELTNYSIQTSENVIQEVANQGDLIGLAIAIAIALGLIFGAVFLVVGLIPRLIKTVKGIKGR